MAHSCGEKADRRDEDQGGPDLAASVGVEGPGKTKKRRMQGRTIQGVSLLFEELLALELNCLGAAPIRIWRYAVRRRAWVSELAPRRKVIIGGGDCLGRDVGRE